MHSEIKEALKRFNLIGFKISAVPEHNGGRNKIYVIKNFKGAKFILRISIMSDRIENDYIAETEFVNYLFVNGASVAGVIASLNGKFVENVGSDKRPVYASLFEYAKGMLISDNGYRYRKGVPLIEYFYNTGKTLGKIHCLSKLYIPVHRRCDYFDKYNMEYIEKLIPEQYIELKKAISNRLDKFKCLPRDSDLYGLVHFDFSDGNYHIDMTDGKITVFDFDNVIYCWYMYDLANLWIHGVGWCQYENDILKRRAFMEEYFKTILSGYRSETKISDEIIAELPLFIDMVLIENIVDEFECCYRENKGIEYKDIEEASESLINNKLWAGFFG